MLSIRVFDSTTLDFFFDFVILQRYFILPVSHSMTTPMLSISSFFFFFHKIDLKIKQKVKKGVDGRDKVNDKKSHFHFFFPLLHFPP